MSYLSSFVPTPTSSQRSVKTSWAGLNKKQTQDSGELSEAHNISVRELPYLKSAEASTLVWDSNVSGLYPGNDWGIASIHAVGNGAYIVFCETGAPEPFYTMYYFDESGSLAHSVDILFPEWCVPSVAPFNVYDGKDIVTAEFKRRILIFPAGISFDPETKKTANIEYEDNAIPHLKQITVLNGRVFGVLDGKIYASEWNNYANFFPQSADELDEDTSALPWISTTQSDVDASGEFTGITVYGGQVIGFKRNFMHMIYNNKNPFRIVDIAKVGAISQAAICEVNQALFFVAEDGVYAFTGGTPARISDKLNIPVGEWEGAVLGGDDRTLYCYLSAQSKDNVTVTYTYDTVSGAWGSITESFADNDRVIMTATVNGKCLYARGKKIHQYGGTPNGSFEFETDITFGGSLVEKKIKRLRLQVVHPTHNEGDYIGVSVLKSDGSWTGADKEFYPDENCSTVLSMLTRMTCDFGQKIRVEGAGDWEIRYLQIDYESGGEKYV